MPQYPPPALTKAFDRRVKAITKHGIKPVFVIDGGNHPMKSATREKRVKLFKISVSKEEDFIDKAVRDAAISKDNCYKFFHETKK